MPIIPIDQDGNEDEWHELRRKHIGASDIAALFNCGSSYTPTLNELYHIKRGNLPSNSGGILAELGKVMEPFIAYMISDQFGWRLERCKAYHIHPEHTALGCTLDYFVVESEHGPGILEIKNVLPFSPGWSQTAAPDHIELQLQHQFLVTNAARVETGKKPFTWGAIGSMHGGNPEDIRIMIRTPDIRVHKHIVDMATRFMDDIKNHKEPPLIGSEDYQHIVDLFKSAVIQDETVLDLRGNGQITGMVSKYHECKAHIKFWNKELETIKTQLMHKLLTETKDGIKKHFSARTDTAIINIKQLEVNYKAQPARTISQVRLDIDEILH
jgi:predicted phage-related endonuclease